MIRLGDATLLAVTKLRTRKLRTTITVVLSALVFAILIAALAISQGIFKSLADFSHEGLNDRYLVVASKAGGIENGLLTKPELIARAKQLHTDLVAQKTAAARQLGAVYDPSTEPLPYHSYDGSKENERLLPSGSAAADTAMKEYYAAQPPIGLPQLQQTAALYHPQAMYVPSSRTPVDGTLATMQQGRESYPDPGKAAEGAPGDRDKLFEQGLTITPTELTRLFMLPAASWTPASGAMPLIVTRSNAEKLLGLKVLPKNASAGEQLDRIAAVRQRATNLRFAVCYRNSVSTQQINMAVAQPNEIKKNVGNSNYQLPEVQYGLPGADSCGAATVIKDSRTLQQKQQATRQATFEKQFGATVDPVQRKLQFQVVGIMPDLPEYASQNTVDGLLGALVGASSLGMTTIPQQLYQQLPEAQRHEDILTESTGGPAWLGDAFQAYLVEFATADQARAFIDQQSCDSGTARQCQAKHRPFMLGAFGSNSIGLADLQHKITGMLQIGFLVGALVAVIIMGGMIGRTVADGRRETAVFRAIGFKRGDITAIYAVYTLLLGMYVALVALMTGVVVAYLLDHYYWQTLTVKAKLAFGASDANREFHLLALDNIWMWLTLLAVIVLGFVAMIIPLLRNVRRNPIKDMRDE